VILIDDWRQAWRFNSVRVAAILGMLSLVQSDVLPYVQPLVPAKFWPYVTLGLAVLMAVFRIVQQNLPAKQDPPQ
jgi:hypothetical protein